MNINLNEVFLSDNSLTLQIENNKLNFKEKAKSKIGSKDNIDHKPGGGITKVCCHSNTDYCS